MKLFEAPQAPKISHYWEKTPINYIYIFTIFFKSWLFSGGKTLAYLLKKKVLAKIETRFAPFIVVLIFFLVLCFVF